MKPLELVSQAIALYITTDLDDVFVLLGFFADSRFRFRQIVAGQLIGITLLYLLSVAGSWLSFVIPMPLLGLLGLVPIAMGLQRAWAVWKHGDRSEGPPASANTASVIALTVANGADNISVYIPFFAMRSRPEILLTGLVFGIMTVIWLYLAYWLTRHLAIGIPVRRVTALFLPVVYIALGLFIIHRAGSLQLMSFLPQPSFMLTH